MMNTSDSERLNKVQWSVSRKVISARRPGLASLVALVFLSAVGIPDLASAGCGLTVTFDNDMKKAITILSVETKTTGGKYKIVLDEAFTVRGGKKVSKAIETNAGCALPHHIRVKYEKGKNTLYKTKGPMLTAVDQKIKLEFDD